MTVKRVHISGNKRNIHPVQDLWQEFEKLLQDGGLGLIPPLGDKVIHCCGSGRSLNHHPEEEPHDPLFLIGQEEAVQ